MAVMTKSKKNISKKYDKKCFRMFNEASRLWGRGIAWNKMVKSSYESV